MAVAKEKLYLWVVVVLSLAIAVTEGRQIHGFDNTKFDFPMLPKNTPIPPSGPNPRDPNIPPPAPTDQIYDSNNKQFHGLIRNSKFHFPMLPKSTPVPPSGPRGDPNIPPPAPTDQFYDSNNFNFGVLPKGRLNRPSLNKAEGLSPPPPPTEGSTHIPIIPPPASTDQFYDSNNFNFGVLPNGRLHPPSLNAPPSPTRASSPFGVN